MDTRAHILVLLQNFEALAQGAPAWQDLQDISQPNLSPTTYSSGTQKKSQDFPSEITQYVDFWLKKNTIYCVYTQIRDTS